MSKTYTRTVFQLVFSTKYRRPCLIKENRRQLYAFLWGVFKKKRCRLYQIGGIEDHIHFIFALHPSVAIATLVKDLKLSSSWFIREKGLFPDFTYWGTGYGLFSYSKEALPHLVNYVKNQESHHHGLSSKAELRHLLNEHDIPYDEKSLE